MEQSKSKQSGRKKPRKLSQLDIREVSLVDRPAIMREFLVVKRDSPNGEQGMSESSQEQFFFSDSPTDESSEQESSVEKAVKLKPRTLKLIKDMYEAVEGDMEDNEGKDQKLLEKLAGMLSKLLAKPNNEPEEKAPDEELDPEKNKKEKSMADTPQAAPVEKSDESVRDLSSVPSEMKEHVEQLYKQHEEAVAKAAQLEELLKAERDERLRRDYVEKSEKEYPNIPGTSVEVGLLLKSLNSLDVELSEKVEEIFKAVNNQLASSELLKETGSAFEGEELNAWGQIEKKAATLMGEGATTSKAAAISKVLEMNPKLYQDYLKEGGN